MHQATNLYYDINLYLYNTGCNHWMKLFLFLFQFEGSIFFSCQLASGRMGRTLVELWTILSFSLEGGKPGWEGGCDINEKVWDGWESWQGPGGMDNVEKGCGDGGDWEGMEDKALQDLVNFLAGDVFAEFCSGLGGTGFLKLDAGLLSKLALFIRTLSFSPTHQFFCCRRQGRRNSVCIWGDFTFLRTRHPLCRDSKFRGVQVAN